MEPYTRHHNKGKGRNIVPGGRDTQDIAIGSKGKKRTFITLGGGTASSTQCDRSRRGKKKRMHAQSLWNSVFTYNSFRFDNQTNADAGKVSTVEATSRNLFCFQHATRNNKKKKKKKRI